MIKFLCCQKFAYVCIGDCVRRDLITSHIHLFYFFQRTSKKAKMSENSDVPRHGMRSKRVLAPSQPGRVTRSGKVLRPQIDVTTESEMPIQVASEVHATETEVLRAQVDATTQAASQVHGANIEQDGPAVTVHTQEG
jgi:hypothetical protein